MSSDVTFYPDGDPKAGQRQPNGVKPVLVEVPANFAELPEEQQQRFTADLAAMLTGTKPEGEPVYRPENEEA